MHKLALPEVIISSMLKKSFGIDKYALIIKELFKKDISKDANYQRIINAFYVVRRNSKWRKIYYEYFESQKKNKHLSFEMILRYLYE